MTKTNEKHSQHRLKPREVKVLLKKLQHSFYRDFILDMPPDTFLPSVNELREKYNISFAIARKFYASLKAEGVIRSERRKGYFIANTSEMKIAASNTAILQIGVVGYLDYQHPDSSLSRVAQVLEVLEKKVNEQGWRVQFFNTFPGRHINHTHTLAMAKASLSAVVYLGGKENDDISELRKLEKPLIFSSDNFRPESIPEFTNITYDQGLIGCNATEYLIESGFSKIAFVSYNTSDWSEERKEEYLKILAREGLKQHIYTMNSLTPDYRKCARDITADHIDAVFCVNDKIALNLQQAGLDCRNIAIMGVDGGVDSQHHNLTTIQLNNATLAETVFTQLVNYFVLKIPFAPQVSLKGNLLKRGSTESLINK